MLFQTDSFVRVDWYMNHIDTRYEGTDLSDVVHLRDPLEFNHSISSFPV